MGIFYLSLLQCSILEGDVNKSIRSACRRWIMAENDHVLPPSAADGMEKIVADLEKYLVRGSGHWTQQEKPDEVSAKLIEWRRKRFG